MERGDAAGDYSTSWAATLRHRPHRPARPRTHTAELGSHILSALENRPTAHSVRLNSVQTVLVVTKRCILQSSVLFVITFAEP